MATAQVWRHFLSTASSTSMVVSPYASVDFEALYPDFGRPLIAAERLIRPSLIQILYSARSERQLMEQMPSGLLFRLLVGLGTDGPAWVPDIFTRNSGRLTADMSRRVVAAILTHREVPPRSSDECFSIGARWSGPGRR